MAQAIMLRHVRNEFASDALSSFMDAVEELKVSLYPAQEEAILEIFAGKNLILSTPTGSGKSLVAVAMHFKSLREGKRSFYTSPIKALVSEKFFSLCDLFGAEQVGMITGDASINRTAPIICCTAEILANMGIAEGAFADVQDVIMDEFHYYSDSERGVAWQIPLLTMPQCRYLLMSATLGDMSTIKQCLEELTHEEVAEVTSTQRPVPLDFAYQETPLHETIYNLVTAHKFPIYVVNFTQRECGEVAQDAMSVNYCTKDEKEALKEAIGTFRFDTPYGADMKRYLLHGVGIHHAGILPKYRLLVERLAQTAKLKVIMGTDTLGVGVNIPIRSVLFSKLCKFDGKKTGILSSRDFKQIAGRAGRKGFDTEGSVVCQAPEHVIENKRAENRHSASAQKKKIVKKQAPTKNYVAWDEMTFKRLIEQPPEALTSQFTISHGLIINCLQNHDRGYHGVLQLIKDSHESTVNKRKLRIYAAQLCRSLLKAGIITRQKNSDGKVGIIINDSFQNDFSLHHSLSVYLVDTLPLLDAEDLEYGLNVLSLVESILESPKVILHAQIDKLKSQKMAELKSEGVDYEDRIEQLEKVEHPKPLKDFIYSSFNAFAAKHPWVGADNIRPKSIAREMFEECVNFNQYVKEYGLKRSEGVLLRYISQVYKTLVQSVPESIKSEAILDIIAFFRFLLARVDTSLIEEWENLLKPADNSAVFVAKQAAVFDPSKNQKTFLARVRSELHAFLKMLAEKNYDDALQLTRLDQKDPLSTAALEEQLFDFYAQHEKIVFGPRERQAQYTTLKKIGDGLWQAQQIIIDPDNNNDWFVSAEVNIAEIADENDFYIKVTQIGC